MDSRVMFRGRSPDAGASEAAARSLRALEEQHGPLRECTVVIVEAAEKVPSVPRYKVSARIDVTHLHGSMTAEPTASDDVLARAVGRVLRRANEMLVRAKARRREGEYVAWASYGGRF